MELTTKEFTDKLYEKATAKGADVGLLITANTTSLLNLSVNAVNAINGDERTKAHLEAQFKLGKFSAEAGAFLQSKIWWDALLEVLVEIAAAGISTLAAAAAQGLVSAMKESGK